MSYFSRIFLLLSLNGLPFLTKGQEFGPEGARWEHCFLFDGEIPPTFSQLSVTSVDSFMMDDLVCTKLSFDQNAGFTSKDTMVVCSGNGQVFYSEGDSLILLYDFTLQVGDTLTIQVPPSLYDHWLPQQFPDEYQTALLPKKVVIDEIETVLINNTPLIRQHFSYIGEYEYVHVGRFLTQKLGFENWIFPYISIDFVELNPYSDLLQYIDQEIMFLDTTLHCTITSSEDPVRPNILTVYPNPASNVLHIGGPDIKSEVTIYNSLGRLVMRAEQSTDFPIHVGDLAPGLYWLRIHQNNDSVSTISFVKM